MTLISKIWNLLTPILSNLNNFSLTWSCGSRQRDTTSSGWKFKLNNLAAEGLNVYISTLLKCVCHMCYIIMHSSVIFYVWKIPEVNQEHTVYLYTGVISITVSTNNVSLNIVFVCVFLGNNDSNKCPFLVNKLHANDVQDSAEVIDLIATAEASVQGQYVYYLHVCRKIIGWRNMSMPVCVLLPKIMRCILHVKVSMCTTSKNNGLYKHVKVSMCTTSVRTIIGCINMWMPVCVLL